MVTNRRHKVWQRRKSNNGVFYTVDYTTTATTTYVFCFTEGLGL